MRILITGATGWIGRGVVSALMRAGHDVVVLSRSTTKAREVLAYPCSFYEWASPETTPAPAAAFDGVQAVLHLAGESVAAQRWTDSHKKRISDSRVLGTRHLVQTLQKLPQPPTRLVSASAIGFYGNHADTNLDEHSPAGQGFLAQVCKDWEKEALSGLPDSTKGSLVRIGIVLGRNGGALEKMVLPFRLGLGGPIGGGKQWMSWIHYEDVIGILIHALTATNPPRILNATSPHPLTQSEFARTLGAVLHRPTVLPTPAWPLRAALGEMSSLVLDGQKVYPVETLKSGYVFKYPQLKNALENLFPFPGDEILETEQWVPKKVEDIFSFFSSETNLEKMTPDFLGFKVIGKSTPELEKGTLIDYRLKIHGVPARWKTLIEEWVPLSHFVDTQLKGPYAKWHHTHGFITMKGGTLLTDRVCYRLPFGTLGFLLAGRFVRKDVTQIFQFRKKVVHGLFGSP